LSISLSLLTKSDDFIWIGVADSDTAHVDASLDLEETFVSPLSAPGVLDNPVWSAIISSSIADSEDSVVNILSGVLADAGLVDSGLVITEVTDDLESNGDWTLVVESIGELNLITLGDVDGSTVDIEDEGVWVNFARLILGIVWVSSLSADTRGTLDVEESP